MVVYGTLGDGCNHVEALGGASEAAIEVVVTPVNVPVDPFDSRRGP